MKTEMCNDCEYYNPALAEIPSFWDPNQGCDYVSHSGRNALTINGNCIDFKQKQNTEKE